MLPFVDTLTVDNYNVCAAGVATPSTNSRFKSTMPTTADLFRQLDIVGGSTRRFVLVTSKLHLT